MTIYHNGNKQLPVSKLEVIRLADGNQSIFFLKDAFAAQQVRQQLTDPAIGQAVLSETEVDGKPVLITRGTASEKALLGQLNQEGNRFKAETKNKLFTPWGIRGVLGFVGQGLVMVSSKSGSCLDTKQAISAGSNLLANSIALYYGTSVREDPYQLRYLKEATNKQFSKYLAPDQLLSIEDQRKNAYANDNDQKRQGIAQKADQFMHKNASYLSIGLRYYGAYSMTLAGLEDKKLSSLFQRGGIKDMRAPGSLAMLFGKTLALTGHVEDPYGPANDNWLNKIRKHFFVTGGLSEAIGTTAMGLDACKQYMADPVAHAQKKYFIAGHALFVLGYIIRSWAKLGVRELDMDELTAHVSDTIARLPPKEQRQVVADISGMLKSHFNQEKNPVEFHEIYDRIVQNLRAHHGITIIPDQEIPGQKKIPQQNHQLQIASAKSAQSPDMQIRDVISEKTLQHTDVGKQMPALRVGLLPR